MGPGGTLAHSQQSLEPEGRGKGAKAASPSSPHGGLGAPPSPRPRRGPPGTRPSVLHVSPPGRASGSQERTLQPRDPRAWRPARRVARLRRRARAPPDPAAHDDTSASQSESPRPLPAHLPPPPPPPPPGSRSSRSQQSPARVQGPRRRQEAGRARAPPRPPSGRRGWGRGRPGLGSPAHAPPPQARAG